MKFQGRDINPIDCAWAAGFLDGEGCFTITVHKKGRNFIPGIIAGQVYGEPLEKLHGLFGGSITITTGGFLRWEICGAQILREVLPCLIPYLTLKRRQAELLLRFCNGIDSRRGARKLTEEELGVRMSTVIELKELKRL